MAACDSNNNNYYYYHLDSTQLPSLGWDLDSFGAEVGVLNNKHFSLVLESPVPPSPDLSTGYLQDAVAEWGNRCKGRRMLLSPHDHAAAAAANVGDNLQGFWNSNCCGDDHFGSLNCLTEEKITIPDHTSNYSIPLNKETNMQEEAVITEPKNEHLSSSSSSYKGSTCTSSDHCSTLKRQESQGGRKKEEEAAARVVYPFVVVKPGGVEGDATLKDVNRRLLMRPTRPVRHPVGEFACLPWVSGDGRRGLSGKAVVGITRIHTQGRGTITIIRTRG